jgi:hypothetical protein
LIAGNRNDDDVLSKIKSERFEMFGHVLRGRSSRTMSYESREPLTHKVRLHETRFTCRTTPSIFS